MAEVISLKFKPEGREYFFDPDGNKYNIGDILVVNTSKGIECATVCKENHIVNDTLIVKPLKKVLRKADKNDLKRLKQCQKKAKEAFVVCEQKIINLNLDMKLVDVDMAFEGGKIVFSFTSDGRVDFRELVKDLAAVFHTRIELRQIGVRDEAKLLGGIGICGQPFCCSRFLNDFQSVSIKMAKEQGLSLNPSKISGCCGRLMCCLKYEQDAYDDLIKNTPKVGSTVSTPDGVGIVTDINLLKGMVFVKIEENGIPTKYSKKDIRVLKGPKKNNAKKDDIDENELKKLELQ